MLCISSTFLNRNGIPSQFSFTRLVPSKVQDTANIEKLDLGPGNKYTCSFEGLTREKPTLQDADRNREVDGGIASSPDPTQILSRSRGEKSGEGLGAKLHHGPEMVDSVSTYVDSVCTNQVHHFRSVTYFYSQAFSRFFSTAAR